MEVTNHFPIRFKAFHNKKLTGAWHHREGQQPEAMQS